MSVLLKYSQFDYEFTWETLGWTTGPFSWWWCCFPHTASETCPLPALREWNLTRYMAWWILRAETDYRMVVMIYVCVAMAKWYLLVTLYYQIYDSVLPPLARMWWIRRAMAFQGHRLEVKDSWCMVCLMRLFFWFVVLRVAKSTWSIRWRGEMRGSWQPPFQKPTYPTVNLFVCVTRLMVPSHHWT